MKNIVFIIIFILITIYSCNKSDSPALLEIDILKKYPEKEISLESIADLHYILPETRDSFLYTSSTVSITENYIIGFNRIDRSFVFFDKTGNPVSKISKYGEGPKEYHGFSYYFYDEDQDEFYICDLNSNMYIYNKEGDFKRKISLQTDGILEGVYNFNDNYILCYLSETDRPFKLFAKQNGNLIKEIEIFRKQPFNNKLHLTDRQLILEMKGYYVIKDKNGFLLAEPSSDIVYHYSYEGELTPVLRIVSSSQSQQENFFCGWIETNSYYLFSYIFKEYDKINNKPFPKNSFIIDKVTKQIYSQKVINNITDSPLIIDGEMISNSYSYQIGTFTYKTSDIENIKKNINKDLKEILDRISEEDDYIISILKFK